MSRSELVSGAFNPCIIEAEAGGSLGVRGQPSLQMEFQDSQATQKPILKTKPNQQETRSGVRQWLGGEGFAPRLYALDSITSTLRHKEAEGHLLPHSGFKTRLDLGSQNNFFLVFFFFFVLKP